MKPEMQLSLVCYKIKELLHGLWCPVTRHTRSSGDDLSFITSVLSITIFVFTGILTICQTVLVAYFESHLLLFYYFLIKIICFTSRCNKLCFINSVQPVHDFAILGSVDFQWRHCQKHSKYNFFYFFTYIQLPNYALKNIQLIFMTKINNSGMKGLNSKV